jgi:hypothetical protein
MRIKCPNCGKTKEQKGRYDKSFDIFIECKNCKFKVKGFCWDYVQKENKKI